MKNPFLLIRTYIRWAMAFRQVNKALKIRLFRWQKRYIRGQSLYMPEKRCSGRTTAYMLRTLLNMPDLVGLITDTPAIYRLAEADPSTPSPTNRSDQYKRWFTREFRQMYTLLMVSPVKLPVIKP